MTKLKRNLLLLLSLMTVAVVIATAALAGSPNGGTESSAVVKPSPDGGPDETPFPWSNPLILGDVGSVEAAQSNLTFQATDPNLPPDLGTLDQIVGTDAKVDGPHAIAWAFSDASGTPFFVEESPARGLDDAVLESWASCSEAENCPTAGKSITKLADGSEAFVGVGAQNGGFATSVVWVKDGVKFTVAGPTDRFSADAALAVANAVITA